MLEERYLILNEVTIKAIVVGVYSVICNGCPCSSHDANVNLICVDKNVLSTASFKELGKSIADFLY